MVNVSMKTDSLRTASATALVEFPSEVFKTLSEGGFMTKKKGAILDTAKLAGIMAVKRTDELIPLCHSLPITGCELSLEPMEQCIKITCTVETIGKTGVEMEALTGASVAALTVYDMTKALSHDIKITQTQLESKSGGKRDFKR